MMNEAFKEDAARIWAAANAAVACLGSLPNNVQAHLTVHVPPGALRWLALLADAPVRSLGANERDGQVWRTLGVGGRRGDDSTFSFLSSEIVREASNG